MNLTLNSQWTTVDQRTYLIITLTADSDKSEATARDIYLDITMPESTRLRYVGALPTNGSRNSIGVDIPDLVSGAEQQIVFRVKGVANGEGEIAPELNLHWIDGASGDLLERHQSGTPFPAEPPESTDELTNIVAAARSARREARQSREHQEDHFMNNHRRPHHHRHPHAGKHHRRGSRRAVRAAFMAGFAAGAEARESAGEHLEQEPTRYARRPYRRRHGHGHGEFHEVGRAYGHEARARFAEYRSADRAEGCRNNRYEASKAERAEIFGNLEQIQANLAEAKHRVNRLLHMEKHDNHGESPRYQRRPWTSSEGNRAGQMGRRMGRAANRAWRDRWPEE